MKVLLTGGTGNVGRAAVAHLAARGYEVLVLGRRSEADLEYTLPKGSAYARCDVTDFEQLIGYVKGADVIVHLAAIPSPTRHGGEQVFSENAVSTFNVFEAAAREGIGRVIQASSINAVGYNFGCRDIDFSYFPLDEHHPTFTTDAYSFSKEVIEDIGMYYFRRDGISSVALRIPGVYQGSEGMTENMMDGLAAARRWLEDLLSLPLQKRLQKAQAVIDAYNGLRHSRSLEYPGTAVKRKSADKTRRPAESWVTGGMANFFTLVDDRDSAIAIEKSIVADTDGSFPLFINDSINWSYLPSFELAQAFYPSVDESNIRLSGTESLVSIRAASELIDWTPSYSLEEQWKAIL